MSEHPLEVWHQHLTVPALIRTISRYGFRDIRIFVESLTLSSDILTRFLGIRVKQVSVELGAVNADGSVLRYAVEAGVSRAADMLVQDLQPILDRFPDAYQPHKDEWTRLLRSSFVAHTMASARFLCFAANSHASSHSANVEPSKVHVCVRVRSLGHYLRRAYEHGLPDTISIETLRMPAATLAFFPVPGLLALTLFRAIRASLAPGNRSAVSNRAKHRGVVLEQYNRHVLTQYPDSGHLYWHRSSGIPHEQIVMYINRLDDSPNPKTISEIEGYGFGWADGRNNLRHLRFPVLSLFRLIWCMRTVFPRRFAELDFWSWGLIINFGLDLEAARQFVRNMNVRLLHQHDEETPRPLILALAVRMEGGAFFWNRWSYHPFPVARGGSGFADVVICPGPLEAELYKVTGFGSRFLIQVGRMWVAPPPPDLSSKVEEIRDMFSAKVRFLIVAFDSSHGADTHHTTASLTAFHRTLIDAVTVRPDWGLLIKPKTDISAQILDEPPIRDDFQALVTSGRGAVLSRYVPAKVAAESGDATVCYSINSAGIFTFSTTSPRTFFFDLSGNIHHPFYDLGDDNKICFNNAADIIEALVDASKGSEDKSDSIARCLQIIDGFDDNLGNTRAGQLFGDYIRARERGLDNQHAIETAVKAYEDAWGISTVPAAEQNEAGQYSRLWEPLVERSGFQSYISFDSRQGSKS